MKKSLLALSMFTLCFSFAHTQTINTIAGNGIAAYTGDGGPATAAELNYPFNIMFDVSGNLFFGDIGNNRVRKIDISGTITTVAGNGTIGFYGDGGQATAAELNGINGTSVDASGNLYLVDEGNQRVRMVNTLGIINTIAGNGTLGYSGDGGQATAAELNTPWQAITDAAGNIYISDYSNNVIRKVNTSGVISTFVGSGVGGFSGDGGQATAAELNGPLGITFDAAGNFYIAEYGGERIRMIDPSGIVSTVAGNEVMGFSGDGGPATAAELHGPVVVLTDAAGGIYISDYLNDKIRYVDPSGTISTIAGTGVASFSGDGGPATAAELNRPIGLALDASNNLYLADASNNRIREITGIPLSVNAPEHKTEVAVYPNPSNGVFNLSIRNYQLGMKCRAEVYNMLGEKVHTSSFSTQNSTFNIDLSGQPNGIYILKVQTEDGSTFVKKIEVER